MVTALPWLVSKLDIEWLWPIDFLELPGGMVAIILSGGNIHNYNLTVLLAANVVLYAGLIYKLLSVREKRKGSNQNHPPSVV